MAQSGLVFFSIDLTYSFLNFRVGVGQRGFRIKGVKYIGRNPFLAVLCWISGITVKQTLVNRDPTVFVGGVQHCEKVCW